MRSDDEGDQSPPLKSYPGNRAGVWVAALLACIAFVGLENLAIRDLWPPLPYRLWSYGWYKDLILTGLTTAFFFRSALAVARLYGTSVFICGDRIGIREWYGRTKSFPISCPVEMKSLDRLHLPRSRSMAIPLSCKWCYLLRVGRRSACILLSDKADAGIQAAELLSMLSQSAGDLES